MIVALASPRPARSLEDGLGRVERLAAEAARKGARVVCFPEAYLPGLRGQDFEVLAWQRGDEERTLDAASEIARRHAIAVILGIEDVADADRRIAAAVFDP